jgi:hypothetical protein
MVHVKAQAYRTVYNTTEELQVRLVLSVNQVIIMLKEAVRSVLGVCYVLKLFYAKLPVCKDLSNLTMRVYSFRWNFVIRYLCS